MQYVTNGKFVDLHLHSGLRLIPFKKIVMEPNKGAIATTT